jgi:hypothetical protein
LVYGNILSDAEQKIVAAQANWINFYCMLDFILFFYYNKLVYFNVKITWGMRI